MTLHRFMLLVCLGFVIALTPMAERVEAQLVVFDEFEGSILNPRKWIPGSVGPTGAVEYARFVSNGELRMRLYGIGDQKETTGEVKRLRNRIYMHPDFGNPSIRAFQTTMRINSGKVRACADPDAATSRARFFMDTLWFNDGRSTGPGDFTGDVFTSIEVRRTSADADLAPNEFQVLGTINQCGNARCTDFPQLSEPLVLGRIRIGARVQLRVTWRENAQEFKWRAKVKGFPPMVQAYSYGADVAAPSPTFNPGLKMSLQTRVDVPDCNVEASAAPRPFGIMDVAVQNVRILRR